MNPVQLRWQNGRIEEHPWDIAWEMFQDDETIWKISWTSPNGKRLRVAKADYSQNLSYTLLKSYYIEDHIKEALLNEAEESPPETR